MSYLPGTQLPFNSSSVFGETQTVPIIPLVQVDSLTDINYNEDILIDVCEGGSCYSDSNGLVTIESGTQANAFSTVRTRRTVRYRSGQGSICRFTCAWLDGGAAGYFQFGGFIRLSGCLAVGYGPTGEFGVLRSTGALSQIWELTITAAATASESVTITLNDEDFTLTIPDNLSLAGTASYIARQPDWAVSGWQADAIGAKISFIYVAHSEPLTGEFSITNNSAGDFSGTGTTMQTGIDLTNNFTPQSEFNVDKLDGTGPSGMTIDPTKLNVFQIDFRWLGAGQARWAIEDQSTGNLIPFHILHYTNQYNIPHLSDPSMRVGLVIANLQPEVGTGTNVRMQTASFMGANQGVVVNTKKTKVVRGSRTSLLASGQYHHILSIKNNLTTIAGVTDMANYREVAILRVDAAVTVSSGTRPVRLLVYENTAFTAGVECEWQNRGVYTSTCDTVSLIDITQGELVADFAVSPTSPAAIDLSDFRTLITRGQTYSFVFYSPAANMSIADVSVMYLEE